MTDLLTCRQVARSYNVHVETIRRWVRKGIIAVVKVGPHGLVRIRRAEAERHLRPVAGADDSHNNRQHGDGTI